MAFPGAPCGRRIGTPMSVYVRRSSWRLSTWSTTTRSPLGSSSCSPTVSSIASRSAVITGEGGVPRRGKQRRCASWTSRGPGGRSDGRWSGARGGCSAADQQPVRGRGGQAGRSGRCPRSPESAGEASKSAGSPTARSTDCTALRPAPLPSSTICSSSSAASRWVTIVSHLMATPVRVLDHCGPGHSAVSHDTERDPHIAEKGHMLPLDGFRVLDLTRFLSGPLLHDGAGRVRRGRHQDRAARDR